MLYHSSPTGSFMIPITKRTFTIPIRQTTFYDSYPIICALLFQSDKRFFIIPLSQNSFTIPFRQRIVYHSCSKTIPSLSQSDKGFFTSPLSNREPLRGPFLPRTLLPRPLALGLSCFDLPCLLIRMR